MIVLPANPKASYLAHKFEIDAAIQRVLDSGVYILGEEVSAFEAEFAAWNGNEYAIGVANGTDALELCLRACGIGPGDVVVTVANTAVATVAAIERCGALPILVDVDPVTYTLDPNSLEDTLQAVITAAKRELGVPRAVIPVHLYGHPANMVAIVEIARKYGLAVVEDCAQAHGASLQGRKVGTWGDMAAFSFYPTKNLGALGDGGMVTTDDARLARQVKLLQQYGWEQRYISQVPGVNSRLDPIQAAILRVKLQHLDHDNRRRQGHAMRYLQLLADGPLQLPQTVAGAVHVYHQFVCRFWRRDRLRERLRQKGIGTQILYPVPIHLQPAYRGRIPVLKNLAVTEACANEIFTLPIYPELTLNQIDYVAQSIRAFVIIKR